MNAYRMAHGVRIGLLGLMLVGGSPVWSADAQSEQVVAEEAQAPAGQVNLNTASSEELQRLPGVGPSRAEAIIEYRERRPFRRVDELMRIRGIGRKTFRRLRPMLTLDGPTTLPPR